MFPIGNLHVIMFYMSKGFRHHGNLDDLKCPRKENGDTNGISIRDLASGAKKI